MKKSMRLNLGGIRLWILWIAALLVLVWNLVTDPDGGKETLLRLQWLAWLAVLSGPVYLLRRALFPEARSREAVHAAMKSPVGAGLIVIGLCLLSGLLFIAFAGRSNAADLPPRAVQYLPALDDEISARWPGMPERSVLGALVEQETCPSLRHAQCWNPRAELKTPREYGFGLGQLTVAYRADGSERFNAWREVRTQDASLAGWRWEDRHDARMQLRAVVVLNRNCFTRLRPLLADDSNALAMCDAAYNGGFGGMLQERRLCASKPGCDPDQWFDHVENTCTKSRVKWRGYGQSACEINRGHVLAVMVTRRPAYAAWWKET